MKGVVEDFLIKFALLNSYTDYHSIDNRTRIYVMGSI